jgi:hypothetical protein
MKNFDLKETIKDNKKFWDNFKFELKYSKNGIVRVYINDRKTKYTVGGYGYCKESSVIAKMINDIIGEQKYNKNIYGNSEGLLSGGTGFNSIKLSFEYKRGCKLEKIYSGLDSDIYYIKFSQKILNKL